MFMELFSNLLKYKNDGKLFLFLPALSAVRTRKNVIFSYIIFNCLWHL
ncbi:hypothetical protein B938_03080 [Bacillus velezensis AS43.3]|nr:hypothetical protein B938_03080 [Bacillus velezensis AS43.3]